MSDVQWWSADEARHRTADSSWRESLFDTPALVLDLRDADDAGEPPAFDQAPCPVIALLSPDAGTAWPVDLALSTGAADTLLLGDSADDAAALLADRAAANPAAAATLARVLRVTADLDVLAALEVESLAYSMLLAGPEFRRWLDGRPAARQREHESEVVQVERRGGVLHVTLDRPHVHNAFNAAMRDALVEALGVAEADYSVGTIEIDGNGPTFCSGGDLSEFGTAGDPVHAHLVRTTRSVGAVLHRLRDRVTVRVNGACTGAGVELPAFARRVVAREDTTFRLPEVGMGLVPGAGGTVSLPRRIGTGRTLLLGLSGIALPAADAMRWGLVDDVQAE